MATKKVTKNRILCLMQFLQENSDEEHPASTPEILNALEREGCPSIASTLRDDIEQLKKAGYDIAVHKKEGLSTTYSWLDREMSVPELQILVDAVSSAQFISVKRSRELIDKLAGMAGPSYRDKLTPRILVSEHVKAPNREILLSVQVIRQAIDADEKIRFRYMQYDTNKKRVAKHARTKEESYLVSPYATIWNNERYYLVGYSDRRKEVNTFRIDRMENVRPSRVKRVPAPADFRIQDYMDKVFWMYDGKEETVTLRCRHNLMDQVIDKFGERVHVENVRKDTFDIKVRVSVSKTFYAWVNQFAGEMTVIAPEHVCQTYAEHLQEALDDVLAE